MAEIYSTSKSARLRKSLLLVLPLLMLLIGVITYVAVKDAHEKIVEFQAVNVAEIVARHAGSGRSVYASQIAGKLVKDGTGGPHVAFDQNKGFVPIPAQFLKMVGREASSTSGGLYQYRPLSKWNLEPTQGLNDDFQKWAWQQLEAQDQANPAAPIAWNAVWRLEQVNGQNTLRYMRADPASAAGCVDCHNAMEQNPEIIERRRASGVEPGRAWKQHQLLGALEVDIPLSKVEAVVATQTRNTLAWIISALGGGLIFVTWFAASDYSRTQKLLTLSWLALRDSLTGLYNSRGLLQQLGRILAAPEPPGQRRALFYVRLLGIEEIVAACGNLAGEQLIKHVAEVLRKRLGPSTLLGHINVAEFAGLLIDQSPDALRKTGEALLYSIKIIRFRWKDKTFDIGANVGVAILVPGAVKADAALKLAQDACVSATRAGANQIHVNGA